MNQVVRIEVQVEARTAAALADPRRLEAVGHLIDRLVQPGTGDPLIALFERTAKEAGEAGLSGEEIDAELASYNGENRV